jgi:hypothetical protein
VRTSTVSDCFGPKYLEREPAKAKEADGKPGYSGLLINSNLVFRRRIGRFSQREGNIPELPNAITSSLNYLVE